jgi:hypothetical protein
LKIGIPQNASHEGAEEILRMKLMDWACSLDSKECIMYAHELHAEWEKKLTDNPIHVDIQGPMFCAIVSTGGQSGFDFIMERYNAAKVDPVDSDMRTRLLNGLACADGDILEGLLHSLLTSGSTIREGDILPLIQRIGMNTAGRGMVLKFLVNNLEMIITTVGGGEVNVISNILSGLSSQLSTQQALDETLKFLSDNRARLEELNVNQASLDASIATIRSNINWVNLWIKPIVDWMERNPHPKSGGGRISGGGFFATVVLLVGILVMKV